MAETQAIGSIIDEEQKNEKEERSWANLQNDILCEILSRVFAGDRVVFQSICEAWKEVSPRPITRQFKLPLMNSDCVSPYLIFSNNKMLHPIYNHRYNVDFPYIPGGVVRVAKDGWFLMTQGIDGIFFLNPFTNEKIRLPSLQGSYKSMHFSSPPTSEDCRVVVASMSLSNDLVIYSMKCGEDTWNSCEFVLDDEVPFRFSYCNIVHCKGLYYFLGVEAELLVHDPEKETFFIYEAPKSISHLIASGGEQYLLETDGKLLALFVSCDGRLVYLYKWNVSKRKFEVLGSLGNKMLFVSRPSSMCLKATIRGTGNKIYFPRFVGDHCLFYSLSTKKFHTFATGTKYDSFYQSRFPIFPTWIMP